MRIVEMCLGPNLGGLELYAARCMRWAQQQWPEAVAVVAAGSRLAALADEEGWRHHLLPAKGALRQGRRLGDLLNRLNIDLIHLHHKADLLPAALAKRGTGTRLLHTRQMLMPHKKKNPYHKFIYGSLDHVLAITKSLEEDLKARLPLSPARISTLYYGLEAPKSRPCADLPSRLDGAHFNLALLGRLEPKKGQHWAMEALAKARLPQAHLHLLGDTADTTYKLHLIDLAKSLGVADQVHFHGFVPQASDYLHCFDALLMPSHHETFGLVLAEAMRAGLPVVAHGRGGPLEIVQHGNTGLLFHNESATELAQQLAWLEAHPAERKAMANAGKADADNRFDEDQHFAQLRTIMTRLVDA